MISEFVESKRDIHRRICVKYSDALKKKQSR